MSPRGIGTRESHMWVGLDRAVRQGIRLGGLWLAVTASAGWAQGQAALAMPVPGVTSGTSPDDQDRRSVYRITRGDELNFRFIYTPELNIQAVVRSDGHLALPIMGDLRVEGLTIQQLTDLVQRGLADQVRRPQVVINVQGSGSQRVFVGGEVVRPGVQPLLGPLTVLQAVMAAEGLKDSAQPAEVVLLRRGPQGETQPMKVDLSRLMAGEAGAQDLPLMPYDVVLVPRSGVANVGLWMDQYVRRALPFSLGFSYTINRNGSLQ
jgi:polysaccharide biosynthesis/export protein